MANFTEGNKTNFSEENKSCTICMCQYELDDQYMILPCLHRFHNECIKEWFARRNTCPNCKDRVMDHFEEEGSGILNSSCRLSMTGNGINIADHRLMQRNEEHNFVLEEEKSEDADNNFG